MPQTANLRWDDEVWGKQPSGHPNNGSQTAETPQFKDCGQTRNLPAENINYILEKVFYPLLQTLTSQIPATANETSGFYTLTSALTAIGADTCKTVTIWLLSSAAENAQIVLNNGDEVILEKGYSMTIQLNNLSRLEAKQSGGEGDILYYKFI